MTRDIRKVYDAWFESEAGQKVWEVLHDTFPEANDSNSPDYTDAVEHVTSRFEDHLTELDEPDMEEDEAQLIFESIDGSLT